MHGEFYKLWAAASGERARTPMFSRWAMALSNFLDGHSLEEATMGNELKDLLQAAGGEVSLHSNFGRWALAVSDRVATTKSVCLDTIECKIQAIERTDGLSISLSGSVMANLLFTEGAV